MPRTELYRHGDPPASNCESTAGSCILQGAAGRHRQAVQEILWLLETVSTAFRGLDTGVATVQGKYFNKIAEDLRKHHKGTTLDQVLTWVPTLHGYLSSPTVAASDTEPI